MGHGFQRLAYFGGVLFAVVILLQYFEFPYGDVISSLFSASKIHIIKTGISYSTENFTTLKSFQNLSGSNISVSDRHTSGSVNNIKKHEASTRDVVPLVNLSSVIKEPRKKQKGNVVSISEMHDILFHNRASFYSMV